MWISVFLQTFASNFFKFSEIFIKTQRVAEYFYLRVLLLLSYFTIKGTTVFAVLVPFSFTAK